MTRKHATGPMCTARQDVNLKELLLQKFGSVEESANRVGCSEKTLRNAINHKKTRHSVFEKISELTGISMEQLLGRSSAGYEILTYQTPHISEEQLLHATKFWFELGCEHTYCERVGAEIQREVRAEYKASRCDSEQCYKRLMQSRVRIRHEGCNDSAALTPMFHISTDIPLSEDNKQLLTEAHQCIEGFKESPAFSSNFDSLLNARSAFGDYDTARNRLIDSGIDIFVAELQCCFVAKIDIRVPGDIVQEQALVRGYIHQALFVFCPTSYREVVGTYTSTKITGGSDDYGLPYWLFT